MAIEKAWIIGPDKVCSWYEQMSSDEAPYYSIWAGKQLKFSYNGNDIDRGSKILDENLSMAVELQSSELLTIRLHPDMGKGVITDKSPYSASINFRCVALDDDAGLIFTKNYYGNAEIAKLKAEIAGLRDDKPKGILGYLEPMLENPDVQVAIGSMVMTAISRILPGIFGGPAMQPAVAGPTTGAAMGSVEDPTQNEMDELQANLVRLEKLDPNIIKDLGKLAEMGEKNPTFFNMLITQLQTK